MEKTAIVTGASRGIGAAAALALAAQGCRVAVCCRTRRDSAESVAARIRAAGGTAAVFCADVSDEAAVRTMFAQVEQTLGPADILVNNAGVAQQKLFTDITAAEWDAMFGVCVKGAFHCCQAALPHMIRQKWGRIINISSMNAYTPLTKIPAYSGAKAAVSNFTEWLAVHFSKSRIRVNGIAPGFFATKQNRELLFEKDGTPTPRTGKILAATPLGRFGESEELIGTLLFLLNNEASGFITGVVIPVDGGFQAYSGV